MQCAQMDTLREQVREIRKELAGRRERARSKAAKDTHTARPDGYQALLERKLARAVAEIEQHVARHKCQE